MRFGILSLATFMTVSATLLSTQAQDEPKKHSGAKESINKTFEDPNLDVEGFAKRFTNESREVYAHRKEILTVCAVTPGMTIADIGAGTGLYTFPFAERVGPKGTVYAVDVSPAFLKFLEREAEARGLTDIVKPVKGGQDTTNLPADSVDLIFICDAYHHFEKPEAMLASIHKSLRPGGRVVLLDFEKSAKASDFVKSHARAEKAVYFREFESAGFTKLPIDHPPALKENFIAVFGKK
jgi:ubiquinone/menaquinone biosynthesis C-methylase UbiE